MSTPVLPRYPGVSVDAVRGGVPTIAGVATSITAFLGRALRGPVDEPVEIDSYGDFERRFGGLWVESSLGSAVRDFFLNGGGRAIIVRLFAPAFENGELATAAAIVTKARLSVGGLALEAANEGAWGNQLRVRVDVDLLPDAAGALGLDRADVFNLTVRDMATQATEEFRSVTWIRTSGRFVADVLERESRLVRVGSTAPTATPAASGRPAAGTDPFEDVSASTGVAQLASDGNSLTKDAFAGAGKKAGKLGLYALENADLVNLVCIPPYTSSGDVEAALVDEVIDFCEAHRAFLLIDPPASWTTKDAAKAGVETDVGKVTRNAALFFPRLTQPNPLRDHRLETFVPCGAVAGIFARTDADRGVWKAPAGRHAVLNGVPELSVPLTDQENAELESKGVNCLRTLPAAGRVVWGARTREGDDRLGSEWKYIPVRRLALYLEESLQRGTQWAVFEPNGEPLWAQIRVTAGAFLHGLFMKGAFQGQSPSDAYLVKCGKDTTTQDDIDRGIVNIVAGFAPLKPAEFVIITIQQLAGQHRLPAA
jgi:phage tail sheath protein FI